MIARSAVMAAVLAGGIVAVSACTSTSTETPAPAPATIGAPAPVVVTPGPPPPPGATGEPVVGVTSLPPVTVGAPASFGDVPLVATVAKVEQLQLGAQGPGEIAGPGVGVTVELRNDSDRPIDLGAIVVNAYYGDGTPASASSVDPSAPAVGNLAAGETGRGVYVFQVPPDAVSSLEVEINYTGSANVVIIRG